MVKLEIEVDDIAATYADCGSHRLAVTVTVSPYQWHDVRARLQTQMRAADAMVAKHWQYMGVKPPEED